MKKVLIVDDEPNIIMTLEYSFRKYNYEVSIARNGEEALLLLETVIPDVILLDIMMPKVDGYETLKRIKKNNHLNHTKVIFLSVKNSKSEIKKGLDLGADKYILKPFSIKKVVQEVNNMLK